MRFGPYEVTDELARGGMGAVYAVVHVETGARYALKTLLPEALGDEEERTRFIREARALAQLEHPNLVRVFSAESEGPRPYLVQELLPGGSLQDRIYKKGPLPTIEAIELTLQVADALALAHSQGILHRDLKPANILVAEDGSTRLADFGLAKRLHGESIRLTKTGQLLGTPAFMAPEQANGLPSDERTDVYGLGAVLHALLAGRPPFAAKSLMGVLNKVINDAPLPLEGQPRSVRAVVQRAMAKDLSERQPTMRIFADELRSAAAAGPDRRGGFLLALGALLAVSVLAAAAWVVSRGPALPTPSPAKTSTPDASPTPSRPVMRSSPARTRAAPVAREPFVIAEVRPLLLVYSTDAQRLAVVSHTRSEPLALSVYDAISGAPVKCPELTGVAQLAHLPGGGFVAGLKKALVFARGKGEPIPFLEGSTLESLCASPSGESVLVSLEKPNALVLFTGSGGQRRRLPYKGAAPEVVLWAERGPLAVSGEGVQALGVEGGSLVLRGEFYRLKGFPDPVEAIYWRQSVLIGNRAGWVIDVELNAEGIPVSHSKVQRLKGTGALGEWWPHTTRIHALLEGRDPPQIVTVAESDTGKNGAMARWYRGSDRVWKFGEDFEIRRRQICLTQGGYEREWVAVATQRGSGGVVVEQTLSARFLRR